MDNMYDDRIGDIWFDEEDPTSEFYNPACCRNVYYDLVIGVFDNDNEHDYDADSEYDEDIDEYYEEYDEYEKSYYNDTEAFDDY